jgi:2-phosphoglycerate kinase
MTDLRCILIGGRSHAGKSTVTANLAGQLGWTIVSTDKLGRHPGRPWGAVPEHVATHYTTLDDSAILDAVVDHQRAMWPLIEATVRNHLSGSATRLVLEGSAIMPAEAATLGLPTVAAVWLTGSDPFLRRRIEADSGYAEADPATRHLIDRFIVRNQGLDAILRAEARQHGLPVVDVEGKSLAEVAEACLVAARRLD